MQKATDALSLDPGTFGGSPAAWTLAKILRELGDTKITAKVASLLNPENRIRKWK